MSDHLEQDIRSPRHVRSSAHASRNEATRLRVAILVVRPNDGVAGAVRTVHDSLARNIDPLSVDAHAIVTIAVIPIGIVDARRIAAVAARPLTAAQALIPPI